MCSLLKVFSAIVVLGNLCGAVNWSTYPQVPKTASINGFADRIYDDLPSCAQPCVKFSVGNTPCPYWDTGCLCIMNQWAGQVALCIAESCSGSDVLSATSLAVSICTSAGASWIVPDNIMTSIIAAEGPSFAKLASEEAATQTSGTVQLAGTGVINDATKTTSGAETTGASSNSMSSATNASPSKTSSSSNTGTASVGSPQVTLFGFSIILCAIIMFTI